MIPVIYLIGKFNVGKSNIFNKINYFENNLSYNFKHLTSFNKNFFSIFKNFNYLIIDTIGFNFFLNLKLNSFFFIYESDILFFILDEYYGIIYEDKIISFFLKKAKKYIFLIINKSDILNLNINILYFFKLGFYKPYLINSSNNFNIFYLINSILNIFCFFKKCFYFFKKNNKIKILIINNDFNNNILNFFFLKKKIFLSKREIFNLNFKFKKIIFSFFDIFLPIDNFYIFNKIKKVSFLKILQLIFISDIIFFIFNPLLFFNNVFILNILLKKFKSLIFFINGDILSFFYERIYFKNFFKKKFKLYFFYIFFIFFLKKLNFYYLSYYIFKLFKNNYFVFKKFSSKNFVYNLNLFLNSHNIFKKISIKHIHQTGCGPILITINCFKSNKINYLKKKKRKIIFFIMKFFKFKSIFLNILFI